MTILVFKQIGAISRMYILKMCKRPRLSLLHQKSLENDMPLIICFKTHTGTLPVGCKVMNTIILYLFRMFFGHSSGSFRQETKNCNIFHWFVFVSWDDRVKHFQHGRILSFVGRLDFLSAPTPSEPSCNQPACRWSHCQWFSKAAEWQCQWCLCNTWRYWA